MGTAWRDAGLHLLKVRAFTPSTLFDKALGTPGHHHVVRSALRTKFHEIHWQNDWRVGFIDGSIWEHNEQSAESTLEEERWIRQRESMLWRAGRGGVLLASVSSGVPGPQRQRCSGSQMQMALMSSQMCFQSTKVSSKVMLSLRVASHQLYISSEFCMMSKEERQANIASCPPPLFKLF